MSKLSDKLASRFPFNTNITITKREPKKPEPSKVAPPGWKPRYNRKKTKYG